MRQVLRMRVRVQACVLGLGLFCSSAPMVWSLTHGPSATRPRTAMAAQPQSARQTEKLQKVHAFVDSTMKIWKAPGLALAIVEKGEIIFSEGFGWRDVQDRLPVTPQTLFALGSCSKAFTAMALGILADEGKMDWDKPVRDYLPAFKLQDDFATMRMTARDLVTHRSGLPRHDLMWYGSPFSRQELFERLQYLEPSKDFRTGFQYQNLMFMAAGCLVEQVSGSTWEEFVRQHIFEPLGMASSNFSVLASQQAPDFALPYQEKQEAVVRMPFRNIAAIGPAGSINSNITDMGQWLKLNLNQGKFGETQVISASGLTQMHTPYMVISQPLKYAEVSHGSYGLGWFISTYRGHFQVSHGGNIDGFSALVALLPQDSLGAVILTNLNSTPLPGIVKNYVIDLLLGLEPVDWNSRVKAEVKKAKETDQEKESAEKAARKTGTKPSHALAEYAGDFEHRAYGKLHVKFEGKTLQATYNSFALDMEHWHYDVFRGTLADDEEEKFLITFLTNEKGDIDRLTVALEPAVKPLIFTRQATAQMSDPIFLAQFAGDYELAGQTVTVTLQGEKMLTLAVPGQPIYELQPYKDTEFNLKSLAGYSVKFIQAKNKTTAVEFHQPNGVFTATKK